MNLEDISSKLFDVCKDIEIEKRHNMSIRDNLKTAEENLHFVLNKLHAERRTRKNNDDHVKKSSQMASMMNGAIKCESTGGVVDSALKAKYVEIMFTSPQKVDCSSTSIDELHGEAVILEEDIQQIKHLLGASSDKLDILATRRERFRKAYLGKEKFTPKKPECVPEHNVETVKRNLFNDDGDDWDDGDLDTLLVKSLNESEAHVQINESNLPTSELKNVLDEGHGECSSHIDDEQDAIDLAEAERILDEDSSDEMSENIVHIEDKSQADNKMQKDVLAFKNLMK